ncbi:MAG: polyphenol oxidase family protein [Mariprofundales bacterium]
MDDEGMQCDAHLGALRPNNVPGAFMVRYNTALQSLDMKFPDAAGLYLGDAQPHQAPQVHGHDILVCSGNGFWHEQDADILIGIDGASVGIRTADCVPVLLADMQAGIVAAVHAGWRGTTQDVSGIAVQRMIDLGATAENIFAAIGPCILPCCFDVSVDVKKQLGWMQTEGNPDLSSINKAQLIEAGLSSEHIELCHICSCCTPSMCFSWRRDGNNAGRHLSFVGLEWRA